MLDPLAEQDPHRHPGRGLVAGALGSLLVLAGVAATGYIFFDVLALISEGSEPRLIAHLVATAADDPPDVDVYGDRVAFSAGIVRLVAYPVLSLLYFIAAGISLGVLRAGVSLL